MARLALPALVLLLPVALAQDADPIAAALKNDKEAYVEALDKARGAVLAAFDKHYDAVKANKQLKIEAQLAQLQKIEDEKKAFDEGGTAPSLPALKVALSEYRTAQKKAEGVCKLAFEKAAKGYRDAGDVTAAVAVLDEMKEFLARPAGGGGLVLVLSRHSGKVLAGSGAAGEKVRTADAVKGDAAQHWRTVPAADGWVYVEHPKSGQVMAVTGRGDGAEVVLARKVPGADSQLFRLAPTPGSKDVVKLFAKGTDKIITVEAKRKDGGARIILWTDNPAGTSGLFSFTPAR